MRNYKGTIKGEVIRMLFEFKVVTFHDFMIYSERIVSATQEGQAAAEVRGFSHPLSRPTDSVLYRLRTSGHAIRVGFVKIGSRYYMGWRLTSKGLLELASIYHQMV